MERPGQKPYCPQKILLCLSKKFESFVNNTFNNFTEMGQNKNRSIVNKIVGITFFQIGTILVIFPGTTPVVKDKLRTYGKGFTNKTDNPINNGRPDFIKPSGLARFKAGF